MSNIISSNYPDKQKLDIISLFAFNSSNRKNVHSNHIWTENITDEKVYTSIDDVRTSTIIYDKINEKFPDYRIENIKEIDELYYAVSPKDAKSSDRLLVDCHYDAPLPIYEFYGTRVRIYRVIVACNHNEKVTTTFPNDNIKVKMDTGDFHGLDYNTDFHCVEGKIPENQYRVLLKLHYILIPNSFGENTFSEIFMKNINIAWTIFSREVMRMSSDPQNIFEIIVGYITIICLQTANNIRYILFILISLIILYLFKIYNLQKYFLAKKNKNKR